MKLLKVLSKPAAWASGWSSAVLCFSAASGYWLAGGAWESDMLGCTWCCRSGSYCLVKPTLSINALLGHYRKHHTV